MLKLTVKPVLTNEEIEPLKRAWWQLANHYKLSEELTKNIYDQFYYEYSGWHRAYHNWSHIKSLFCLWETYREQLKDPNAVALAIWFHDFVYDAKKKDNELQSSLSFERLLASHLDDQTLELVSDFILSTAGHEPQTEHPDCMWFLDFDLGILATERPIYQQYSEAIAEEYKAWHSFFTYKTGRKRVLITFLERERLYLTNTFYEQYESVARNNIEWEIGVKK